MLSVLTGATGAIGLPVAARLLSIKTVERLTAIVQPTSDVAALRKILKSLISVIYGAAFTRFRDSESQWEEVNVKGTCEVLRWRETNCPDARLIYLSTLCAAGKCIGPIAEAPLEMPKGFVNGYEASKWRAEQIVQATGGPIVIVRLATVVGAQSDGSLCRVGAFGDPEWSKERIALLQVEVDRIARRCGLPVHWETAEDPFFLPTAKGKALMQRLMETKKELVWDGPGAPCHRPHQPTRHILRRTLRNPTFRHDTRTHCLCCLRIRSTGGPAKIR